MKRRNHLLVLAALAVAAVSCSGGGKVVVPDISYADYVSAYTGGQISSLDPVMVRLVQDVSPEDQAVASIFSFTPSVKGTVSWVSPREVRFIPDEPGFTPGTIYSGTLDLSKIGVASDKFPFSFFSRGEGLSEGEDTGTDNGKFRVKTVLRSSDGGPHVDVVFSKLLGENASLKGLIELEGPSRQYVQVHDNIAGIYYEGGSDQMELLVSGSVRSNDGESLGESYEISLALEEEKPAVELLLQGTIMPDNANLVLPFRAVNLAAVDISVIRIYEDNVLLFLQDNSLDGDDALRRSGRLILRKTLSLGDDPSLDLHQWNDYSVDLSGLFKKEPGAIYRIRLTFNKDYSLYGLGSGAVVKALPSASVTEEDRIIWDTPSSYYWESFYNWDEYDWDETDNPDSASYYMESERFPAVNLMTSTLGVVAKYAGGDRIWVNVNKIMDAKPASGVALDVYDYQLRKIASAKTDGNGEAEIRVDRRPFVVTASSGGYVTYLKVNDGTENTLSRFDVGGKRVSHGIKSYIYGERGVWRPGDTLHVTMLISDPLKTIPSEHPATVEVYTPEGQFLTKQTSPSVDGFYTFHIPTSPDAPTGFYNAYFKVGSSTFHKSLHVESLKPNRLKVTFDPGSKVLIARSSPTAKMTANWLTGPAASGLKASAELTLQRGGASPFKGFEGYTFNNPASSFEQSTTTIFEATLSQDGTASKQIAIPSAADAPGMLSARIISKVMETGGDESFTVQTLPFSPYSAYVGLKFPEGEYLETDKDQTIKVAVVDPEGKRVGGHQLEYRVFKLSWSWWWESRSGELDSYVNGTGADAIASGTLQSSASSDATFSVRVDYPEWGRYLVFVRDLTGGHVSGRIVTIDWPSYRGRADRSDPEGLTMMTFSTDKTDYAVGEEVTVYVPGAAGGQALISVENASGVLSRSHVSTTAGKDTPFKFRVTDEMAPNAYVYITLIQPYGNADSDLPLRLYGVKRFNVTNPESHLSPVIGVADTIHPEEEFTVTVSEKSGKPMTYTLAIVDEGLLDITAFKTPDAWNSMYEKEALGVRTWDMYDDVVGAFSGRFSPMFSVGGDQANIVASRKDNRFNPVVVFQGPFTLEKGKKATHKIRLPMYVGSVRVMVVAGHDKAYGSAEKAVAVTSPLMVLSTLPRILSEGETVTLPVNIFSMEEGSRTVKVDVSVEGPAHIEGSSSESLSFNASGDKVARFALASDGEGLVTVKINAVSGSLRYSDEISVMVRNPNPETVSVREFEIPAGRSVKVSPEGTTVLSLAGFPAVNASGMFAKMKGYPYDCTEQLSARGLVMLHLMGLLSESEQAEAREIIPQIIESLYARQGKDGGFVCWKGGTRTDTWVSSMAGQFLTEAAGAGFPVEGKVLTAWQGYQNKICQAYRAAGNSVFTELDQAYRLYTLAVAGKAQTSAMNRLKESDAMGYRATWMLAAAYAVEGKASVAKELVSRITNAAFEENGQSNPTYGSSLRDKAVALDAMALSELSARTMSLASEVARYVNGSSYYSTDDAAFVAVAMDHLAAKVPSRTVSAQIGGAGVDSGRPVHTVGIDSPVEVKNTSEGPLFATVVNIGKKPAGESVKASANGLSISVSYTDANGKTLNVASLAQGTEFTSTVTVRNTGISPVDNLALTEMIPGGWEIVNERLTGTSGASYDNVDIRDDRASWFFSLGTSQTRQFTLRLRAAYEGAFTLPAITCEAMYDARIAANTASSTTMVTR